MSETLITIAMNTITNANLIVPDGASSYFWYASLQIPIHIISNNNVITVIIINCLNCCNFNEYFEILLLFIKKYYIKLIPTFGSNRINDENIDIVYQSLETIVKHIYILSYD